MTKKAIILAAGKGERLKEITQSIPKPMIEFRGKPILQHNIELCKKNGIEDIYINVHHLPEKITEYFGDGKNFGVNIAYSYEDELLGTAGAVKKILREHFNSNRLQVPNSLNNSVPFSKIHEPGETFFVIYGDNFSEYDLELLLKKNIETNDSCVIAFHYREDVEHSGVAELDEKGKILKFIEKPKSGVTSSHWVNAGIYLLNSSIDDFILDGYSDFGKDVFPLMLKNNLPLYGICENRDVLAFDNPEMYKKSIEL